MRNWKRRLLAGALALVVTAGLLPTAAMGQEYLLSHETALMVDYSEYNLWVNNVRVTSANANNVLGDSGDPTVVYDSDTNTLTLSGATLSTVRQPDARSAVIWSEIQNLTINLVGENKVTAPNDKEYSKAILTPQYHSLTITGPGTLIATVDKSDAIFVSGALTITDQAKVTATTTNGSAIFAMGPLTITGGSTVEATTTNGSAIYTRGGSLTITGGSKVTATTTNGSAISIYETSDEKFAVDIQDNASLTANGNMETPKGGLTIGNGATFTLGTDYTLSNPGDRTITIEQGGTFENNGTLTNNGNFTNNGVFTNNSSFTNNGNFTNNGTITGSVPDAIKVEPLALKVGESGQLTATKVDGTAVAATWASDNDTVATVDAATGLATAKAQGTATITATYSPVGSGIYKAACTVTVTMPTYYPVTVNRGTANPASAAQGVTVNITADAPAAGQRFTHWTASPGVTFANPNSASTSFEMPAGAVTVTANFEPIPPDTYLVTVNRGTANPTSASQGATVSITADAPPAGQRFSHWTASPSVTFANPNSASTTFTMLGEAVTVTAHFENIPTPPSGGGDDSEPTYRPDVEDSQGGTTTVSPRNPERGDKVTITPKPDDGYEVGDVTVTDLRGWAVEVKENSDGTYTFTQPSGKVTIEVTYQPVETAWVNPFTDVAAGDWCYEAVEYVQKNGLMQGTGPATFSPDDATSRGMIVAILWRMAGSPAMEDEIWGYPFADVDATAYYGTAVYWARLNGIANGYGDEAFGPNDPISREQLAVMLYNYAGQPPVPNLALTFDDADQVSGYADSAMRWAVDMGIIGGKGGGILDPKGQATRAQAAAMLMRFCER